MQYLLDVVWRVKLEPNVQTATAAWTWEGQGKGSVHMISLDATGAVAIPFHARLMLGP